MQLGMIGFGRMGANMVRPLRYQFGGHLQTAATTHGRRKLR